jgi:hypothetical protein
MLTYLKDGNVNVLMQIVIGGERFVIIAHFVNRQIDRDF